MEQEPQAQGIGKHPHRSQTWKKLAADLAAAAVSALLVVPPVALIDRAVVEKLSYNQPLAQGLRKRFLDALGNPAKFLTSRPFRISWTLYASTYAAANTTHTLASDLDQVSIGTIASVSTMMVNIPLGIWKDIRFAQIFGTSTGACRSTSVAPSRLGLSKPATATFLLRDAVTIFGSFTMAPAMAAAIPDSLAASSHTKNMVTQMTVPVLSQLAATPAHLLGLDYQSRWRKVALSERLGRIQNGIQSATFLRCLRIIPVFGVGCIVNTEAQAGLHRLVD